MNLDVRIDVHPTDAVIPGFREGFVLLPHQTIGYKWMRERENPSQEKYGGILADDMGIVCPLSLVGQWASEIERVAPGLAVLKHQGPSRTQDLKSFLRVHVVITTYDTLTSEHNSFKALADGAGVKDKRKNVTGKPPKDALFRAQWCRIVLDEAHKIKNRKTQVAGACCALDAKFRWTLTGTPMQNGVSEIFSLLKFLRVKPIDNWEYFNSTIAKPLETCVGVDKAMKRLQLVLQKVMLRRLKTDKLNGNALMYLPSRYVEEVSCDFTSSEREFYDNLVQKTGNAKRRLFCSAAKSGQAANYMAVLLLLLRLRQACDHPALVSKDYKEGLDSTAYGEDTTVDDASREAVCLFCKGCSPLAAHVQQQQQRPCSSAKIRKILDLLSQVEEKSNGGDKTIIFSQFTLMLTLIEPFLKNQGIRFVRYDGAMSLREREKSIEYIQKDENIKVILISFLAGNTGLNLTACNHVILVEPWWNPSLEDQASDRVYRFGQQKDVHIYKLKIDSTVEDSILRLQRQKRQLTRAALGGNESKNIRQFGMNELLGLFGADADDGVNDQAMQTTRATAVTLTAI
ncbi:hypothetical protein K435DRAFT_817999 [Dendrothele bispora CBS 962.96]|uniref:P-loop containing nucleoside triphosphate hydrolase protein n=1 Tax=Dendrothele bispora (strain CBS 962.96) TaxID=1314807 RepID=A0A4V4HH80_DENBC|nr:hypothetical protein K435DRAFT_817999 [Dendrothele bispora CBS 962.96]